MTDLIYILTNNLSLFIILILLISLLIGSFLNVVIARVPNMLFRDWKKECQDFIKENIKNKDLEKLPDNYNLMHPASHCPKCNTKILAKDNIPIISFLLLRGKCRNCKDKISLRYPIIEFITAFLSTIVAYKFGFSYSCLFALLLTWCLITQICIDLDHMMIPDNITLPMLWLALLVSISGVITNNDFLVTSTDSILGATFGYLSLWTVYQLFKLCTKKEGMGYGDFKLLAMLGAWLGWKMIPQIIIISSIVGAIVGVTLMFKNKVKKSEPIPFGPYLATAGWIAMIWGKQINHLYIHTFINPYIL